MSIFEYSQLSKFLSHIKKNYPVTSFECWKGDNAIILRHDVDFDLGAAYRLALIEKKFHLKSTFFILMSAETYNPLSIKNRQILSEMRKLGFEIGLHFDPIIYKTADLKILKKHLDKEAGILSSITKKKVQSVSLHNPSITNKYPIFAGYHNAYDPRNFNKDNYLSDSRMIFSIDIYEFVKKAKDQPIQILLHPLHYTQHGDTYVEIFCQFLTEMTQKVDKNFIVNHTYRRERQKKLIELFVERQRRRNR